MRQQQVLVVEDEQIVARFGRVSGNHGIRRHLRDDRRSRHGGGRAPEAGHCADGYPAALHRPRSPRRVSNGDGHEQEREEFAASTICVGELFATAVANHSSQLSAFAPDPHLSSNGDGLFTEIPAPERDRSSSIPAWLLGTPGWSSQATVIRHMTIFLGSVRAGGIPQYRQRFVGNLAPHISAFGWRGIRRNCLHAQSAEFFTRL
jgi:hypothetical protein